MISRNVNVGPQTSYDVRLDVVVKVKWQLNNGLRPIHPNISDAIAKALQ